MIDLELIGRITGRTIGRVSFDFTSIADSVFSCAEKQRPSGRAIPRDPAKA
ncbi:hypothetical protein LLY42_18515 [Pseudomonas frederiksbergensis]|uniref:Uncharacterized protein n=1 Tax=Pseudomonas cucumis TaxID=2954082 RepID=A0ABY9EQ33_9PSED|nr:hypothetical protein [Pseudomonas cucumis]URM25954.1 hypothetical protein LLY42_18515 [Pseudomonas frederiksbergensis]WLG82578.1 hypothetical protein PSH97_15680 [Pseudomonas cucumis]